MSDSTPSPASQTASGKTGLLIGITVFVIAAIGLIVVWPDGPPEVKAEVIQTLEHPGAAETGGTAYTQGLEYVNGEIWEGTGERGASGLRRLDPKTGALVAAEEGTVNFRKMAQKYFGEGITVLGDHLWQLTYTAEKALKYNLSTLWTRPDIGGRLYDYKGQGWGLTNDGTNLIMSNGTDKIVVRDPETFETVEVVNVVSGTEPVTQLNELELIEGELFANIYQSDTIVVIQWSSGGKLPRGHVTRVINLEGLKPEGVKHEGHVLNGIAWWPELEAGMDRGRRRLLVTGKNWPKMFVVEFDHE